jgi:hypothetical protein
MLIVQHPCQMRGLDVFAPREIGNRARQFEDAMIRARGQILLSLTARFFTK